MATLLPFLLLLSIFFLPLMIFPNIFLKICFIDTLNIS